MFAFKTEPSNNRSFYSQYKFHIMDPWVEKKSINQSINVNQLKYLNQYYTSLALLFPCSSFQPLSSCGTHN